MITQKTKSATQRRLEFLKAVRFGRYVLNELVRWASYEGLHSSGRTIISRFQRRLDFLKAVRFGRFVLDDFACWASCEGVHNLGRIFIYSEVLENQICDPASAGISEGHQIWKVRFRRYFLCMSFIRGLT